MKIISPSIISPCKRIVVGGFLAETNAILARGQALGYALPSANVQAKMNEFIATMKNIGVWATFDILYPMATDAVDAGSSPLKSSFATLNWKNPNAYQCSLINAPLFTNKKGYNGTGYLNTGFNPFVANAGGANIARNNASYTAYMDTVDSSGLVFLFGANDGTTNIHLGEDNTPGKLRNDVNMNNSTTPAIDKTVPSSKWLSMNRIDSTNINLIQEQAVTATGGKASFALPNANLTILSRSGDLPTNKRASLFSAGANITSFNDAYRAAWYNYFNNI